MLPQFPCFKVLELSDHEDVRQHTSCYPPFSDFDFAGLWSWDVDGNVQISMLHDNLVVKFVRYETRQPFYSFLGAHNVDDTVANLIDLSQKQGLRPSVELVPEFAASKLDLGIFSIEEDPNEADYVLSVDEVVNYRGSRLASKRNEVRKFQRCSPQTEFHVLDFEQPRTIDAMQELFQRWCRQKHGAQGCDHGREFKAFQRYLKCRPDERLIAAGVSSNDVLVAFSISEIIDDNYAVTRFEKVDSEHFPGIGAFLNQEVAKILSSRGMQFINIEQDMGIAGLRASKRSYAPCNFLRKYVVSYRAP